MSVSSKAQSPVRRKSLWSSNIISFILLGVFLLIVFGIEMLLKPKFSGSGLVITGIILAIIPAIIWLAFFYRQDRIEPEPKGMVFEVFLLGGLLCGAIAIPVIEDVFKVSSWIYENFWITLVGSILVIGFTQEFLKYAAVRFSIYESDEFDERTDGIVYATAAGLGFATILNINYIISSGGVNLTMGAIRIVLTALAQASFAGITGHFLAKEKLDHKPAWWTPVGVTIAAVLNGVFYTLYGTLSRASISTSGAYVNPWVGLVIAVVLSVAVTYILSWFIDRDQKRLDVG